MNEKDIQRHICNVNIIKTVRDKFYRLPYDGAKELLKSVLYGNATINAKQLVKVGSTGEALKRGNVSKFDAEGNLKIEFIKEIKEELFKHIGFLEQEYERKITKENDETYNVHEQTDYVHFLHFIMNHNKDSNYIFDFNNKQTTIFKDTNKLQTCDVHIIGKSIPFDFVLVNRYTCNKCGSYYERPTVELECTNGRFECEGMKEKIVKGEIQMIPCGHVLMPHKDETIKKQAYFYNVNIKNARGDTHNFNATSFVDLNPGYFVASLFKVNSNGKLQIHIVDVKEYEKPHYNLVKKVENENYVFTLVKDLDKMLLKQTNLKIYGLYPIKVCLLLQKLANELEDMPKNFNIQLVGDASTGKSLVLKYWGYMMDSFSHLQTSGMSISVAGMRGTNVSLPLFNKEIKAITKGYLGTYKSINIDEAGDNKELIKFMKTFLYEESYGFHKAGGVDVIHKRTAHINLSENLDTEFMGLYRGSIRKAYNDSVMQIGNEPKHEWDESWDLYKPLHEYDNLYLRKMIREKRMDLTHKHTFWVDGYDLGLHERFPFYFYLTTRKRNDEMELVLQENAGRKIVYNDYQLMHLLNCEELQSMFNECTKFAKEHDNIVIDFKRVTEILYKYGLENVDNRTKNFYYMVVKLSCIYNKRVMMNEQDVELLQYIIENTHRKIDIIDTNSFVVRNEFVNHEAIVKAEKKIEEGKVFDDQFKLPQDEFATNQHQQL